MIKKPKIDIISILGENDAIKDGHFELPCGLHIQSYVDTSVIMQYPSIASKIAKAMADLFDKKIDVVFSATVENAIIAQEVARVKNARAIFAITEDGTMKLKGGMVIRPKENVLIVDNVTMTGRKVKEAVSLVRLLNANAVGVAVIVDRSSSGAIGNLPLRSLLSYPLDTYEPAKCPMCKTKTNLTRIGEK
jgi:orotate phosphoribosyltransferase